MNIRLRKTLSITVRAQTSLVASVLVFLLCTLTSTCYMIDSHLITVIRYATVISCAVFSMFTYRHISKTTRVLFLCAAVSGIFNILFIGNSTYHIFLYTLMSIFIALLLCNPCVSPQCLLYSMYLHAFMVAYCFARYGLYASIYFHASNNFVSCHLLLPLTVYYALLERRGERIPIFPALIAFILSVLAMGRGGIISAGILLAGILFRSVKNIRPVYRMSLFALLVIGVVAAVHASSSLEVASHFNQQGISDNGRFAIWTEYLHSILTNNLYFWLGAKFKELPLVTYFENNLHNSFLNIHAFNGMVMFVVLFRMCLHSISYAIRHKRFIFLTCMVSLFFRGATDQLLWGTIGTPFLLFFLMTPYADSFYQKKWLYWQLRRYGRNATQKLKRAKGLVYEL